MRVAGVREFRNRTPEFVRNGELVFVTRRGRPVGILVPLSEPESLPVDLRRELVQRLGEAMAAHLRRSGVSERQVLRDFSAWRKTRRGNRRRR